MNKWIKLVLVVVMFAILSFVAYFILRLCGITNIKTLKLIIENSKNFGLIVFCLIMTLSLILLCFIPLLDTSLVFLGIFLFGPIKTFIVCVIANFLSSSILFLIGDKFGENIAAKLVGVDELHKAQDLIDTKSKFLLPVLFIIPGIPDESLCLVAGMTKMRYWYLILVSMIYHILETALFCFLGSGIIDWKSVSIIEWFLIVNTLVVDIILLFKFEKFLEKRSKK